MPAKIDKGVTVTLNAGQVVYVHEDHVESALHAPTAEQLAANGIDRPPRSHGEGEQVTVPADLADRLVEAGVVSKS